jgi:serine phosphatase RsbU (regulator of sigma subunit)
MRIFPKLRLPRHKDRPFVSSHRSPKRHGARPAGSVRLLDLSSAVGTASSVEDLYESLVSAMGDAFSTPTVSLFVRDDNAGHFPCVASTVVSRDSSAPARDDLILWSDSFVVRRLKNLSSPLQVDSAELSAWKDALSHVSREIFDKRMHEKNVLLQTRSSLLVQLRSKGNLLGVLSLGERSADRFSPEEREVLDGAAGQLALVIENTKLLQRLVEHERLRAELAVAAEVQRNLLPATGPVLSGIDLCGFCQPASQVGGDYYDFVPLGDNRVGICIADVAGKGISAALLMSVVQASLRSQLFNTEERASVRNVVTMLNRLICTSISASRYVTCFYGQLDVERGSFRFVNAGHNPPLLYRRPLPHTQETAGAFQSLTSGGTVLGMFPGSDFEEDEVLLHPGDILVAYTDGVTEAMNVSQEEFSEGRLRAAIAEASHQNAKEIQDHIIACVALWSKGASQHDDITVIVLRVGESSNPTSI